MGRKIRKNLKVLANNKGFTLIEMAIVLIIIGIIIGAVIKGKDLIRGAEQKKVYTKYVNAWRLSYVTFYDRTGKRLGDFYDTVGAAEGQDSKADTDNDAGGITDVKRGYLETGDAAGTDFRGLDDAGLTTPATNSSNSWEYIYTDNQGTGHNLAVAFKYDTASKYNYMWITEIPNALGMSIDTMVDGEADGLAGDFLCYNVADDTNAVWGAATTEVSARWKMDF